MMKKSLLFLVMICGSQAMAAPHLIVGDNLTVLATKDASVSIFSSDIPLKEGEQRVVVRYDSPENPTSTNQSNGRVTSKPYLLTFNASGNEVIELTTKTAADTAEVRKIAADPTFDLSVKGKAVSFTRSPLIRSGIFGINSGSWDTVVNDASTAVAPTKATTRTGTDTMKAMQQLYLQSDAQQRKAFLKWALDAR